LLFLGVIKGVDDGVNAGGEVVLRPAPMAAGLPPTQHHAGSGLIVAGEGGAFFSESGSIVLQLFSACGDLGGAALHFGHFDEPAWVEVDEAAPLGIGGIGLGVESRQFGGEGFVVGGRGCQGGCLFAGQQ
jgi:hypothetical protein